MWDCFNTVLPRSCQRQCRVSTKADTVFTRFYHGFNAVLPRLLRDARPRQNRASSAHSAQRAFLQREFAHLLCQRIVKTSHYRISQVGRLVGRHRSFCEPAVPPCKIDRAISEAGDVSRLTMHMPCLAVFEKTWTATHRRMNQSTNTSTTCSSQVSQP